MILYPGDIGQLTGPQIINDKYRSSFEKRGLFKSITKGDYTTGFDFFYKRLKSIQNKEQ